MGLNFARRAGLLGGALVALATAALIVIVGGLPERAAYTGWIANGQRIAPETGALAPSFSANTLNGETTTFEAVSGSPVIINFWATWCAPCRDEMPILQAFYETHRAAGLRVLAVNLAEDRALIHAFVDEFDLTFDIIPDENREIAALYYFRAPPASYIISPQGMIIRIVYGPVTYSMLESTLAPYLTN